MMFHMDSWGRKWEPTKHWIDHAERRTAAAASIQTKEEVLEPIYQCTVCIQKKSLWIAVIL